MPDKYELKQVIDGEYYTAVNHILTSRIVVDVDSDAAEGGHLGGEFIEEVVVLPVGGISGRTETRVACARTYCSRS